MKEWLDEWLDSARVEVMCVRRRPAQLDVIHAAGSVRTAADSCFDQRFLAAKHAFGGTSIVVVITCEVKKAMDRIAHQLLAVWNVAFAGFPGSEV